MSIALDPRISEFQTDEAAASYDRWFRAKVQEALDSNAPRVPHDQAVARIAAMLQAKRDARAAGSVD
jgi:hypothetical protein